MTIRKSGENMVLLDDRILEYLEEEGHSSLSSIESSKWIRESRDKVRDRCEFLCQTRLIREIGEEEYAISFFGGIYLEGWISSKKARKTDILEISGNIENATDLPYILPYQMEHIDFTDAEVDITVTIEFGDPSASDLGLPDATAYFKDSTGTTEFTFSPSD